MGFLDSARNDACEMHFRMSTPRRIFIAVFGIIATAQFARADSPSVTAVLNSSEAALGETVHLEIRVAGAHGADAPENIMVDGLEIRRTGTSQRIEMNNLNLTSSVIYDYTVMPLRAGRFTIPPQTIHVGNNSLRTPALTLNVADSPGRSSGTRPGRDAAAASASSLVFAELIVPSKTAYVGEIVPVQVRMGFDPRVRPRLVEPPEITGQGFTAQKLQQSGENTETISGRPYEVVTFKTAIAAARAGILTASMRRSLKTSAVGTNIRHRPSSSRTMRSVSVAPKLLRWCFHPTRKSRGYRCSRSLTLTR